MSNQALTTMTWYDGRKSFASIDADRKTPFQSGIVRDI